MIGGKHVFQGEKKPIFSCWVIFFFIRKLEL